MWNPRCSSSRASWPRELPSATASVSVPSRASAICLSGNGQSTTGWMTRMPSSSPTSRAAPVGEPHVTSVSFASGSPYTYTCWMPSSSSASAKPLAFHLSCMRTVSSGSSVVMPNSSCV